MATPHVAGTVALMLRANSSLSPAEVKQILKKSSFDLGKEGGDNTYGAGRIDAYAAVSYVRAGRANTRNRTTSTTRRLQIENTR